MKLNLHKLETSGISDLRASIPDFVGYSNVADLLYSNQIISMSSGL